MTETLTPITSRVEHAVREFPETAQHETFVYESLVRENVHMGLYTTVSGHEHGDVNLFDVVAIEPGEGLYGPKWTFRMANGETVRVQAFMQNRRP